MSKNLVIVESPAKAKTIEKYLGSEFTVRSCFGHIRDLPKDDSAIDVDKGYLPKYEVSADKKKVVSELKKLAKKADVVWLASDEDREGEAISWHLAEVLDLTDAKTKRIVFNEITKKAILNAIDNPRSINKDLVDAQQARRVLDRLVGFELSPVLWKKIKPSLSAGRVQSVAVRLIVEREKEIQGFTPSSAFKIDGLFTSGNKKLPAELTKRPSTEKEAMEFLETCRGAQFEVSAISVSPAKRNPAAPFTTSTLQQEASRKLGYSVSKTMTLAQRLYENGHITYMRTDSVNLSDFALATSKQVIEKDYGEEYSKMRKYSTKSNSAQEAHEAIRPTDFNVKHAGADDGQKKLYELIWKRSIASQMSSAELERTTIDIVNNQNDGVFKAKGEVIKFDGFLKVYLEGTDDEDSEEQSGLLPKVSEGEVLMANNIKATERFTRPKPRYTEASLVKRLEELGIGRPSTYAPTISTIQKRGYVVKDPIEGKTREVSILSLNGDTISVEKKTEGYGADKNKLHPSDIGKVVTDFLIEHFDQIMDYNFTASVEKQFDEIAHGLKNWSDMIDSFYKPFHSNVSTTLETAERATGERLLGQDPKSGSNVYARIGRFGPMIQMGESDQEEKPKFASITKGQTIDSISLDEALELFKLPRKLGEFEGQVVDANIGRYGPYVRHNKKFYSLPKEENPMSVSLDRAIELIQEKRKEDANRIIKEFNEDDSIQVLNGRYGPYIKAGKKNYRIPKSTDPAGLSFDDVQEIIKSSKK